MADMQDAVLECRKGTFTHLHGGFVLPEYVVPGEPGISGQPTKFYAPAPLLETVGDLDYDELDALMKWHFKLGMSWYELGQFLIQLGCPVDLTKFSRMLLQKREHGQQQGKPQTGRRGLKVDVQQVASWHSVFRSQMGDAMPHPSHGRFDEHLGPDAITRARDQQGTFKRLQPVQQFPQFWMVPTPLMAPLRDTSPAGSHMSLIPAGTTAATYHGK